MFPHEFVPDVAQHPRITCQVWESANHSEQLWQSRPLSSWTILHWSRQSTLPLTRVHTWSVIGLSTVFWTAAHTCFLQDIWSSVFSWKRALSKQDSPHKLQTHLHQIGHLHHYRLRHGSMVRGLRDEHYWEGHIRVTNHQTSIIHVSMNSPKSILPGNYFLI